jgi:hypothetical protein
VFSNNYANQGGGIYNFNYSSPSISNSLFSKNSATQGGGIANFFNSSPVINNTVFSEDTAKNGGGGIYICPACSSTIINSLFNGNYATAADGAGVYNAGPATIVNSTFYKNNGNGGNAGAVYSTGNLTLNNSIVWGNSNNQIAAGGAGSITVMNSDVQGGYTGTTNINSDPKFIDSAGGNFQLQTSSPAIDAGSNELYIGNISSDSDLAGNPRLVGITIDMGAFEYQHAPLPLQLIQFNGITKDGANCLTWKTADEINTKQFIVERSIGDGQNFTEIGIVASQGFGNGSYHYTDNNPTSGTNYYRLKMEDNNGSYKYSNIILLNSKQSGNITIYPNPATGMFTINVPQSLINTNVSITDSKGATLLKLTITNPQQNVDISSWSSGMYFVRFEDGTVKMLLKK